MSLFDDMATSDVLMEGLEKLEFSLSKSTVVMLPTSSALTLLVVVGVGLEILESSFSRSSVVG